ncbi:tetratricopeptide repeat-containing sulfotransferase family protein [Rubinisphaera margarita]|uniref:tetratricopeptide repeat-containing sulfotransferase family protein n=1 Tax=Rubinisphaera margarita TaxID=2909586 RepID=UPI001EE7BD90|nr:tetratricopeptide repeat-containing sulfotransferase family protein [Rubinisphaera margarita]MCG6157842.1 tetratricopeptide repeat protein [Rubinisphaera margarita]
MSRPVDFDLALQLHQQGDFAAAIDIYDQLLQTSRSPVVLHVRGLAEHHRGQPEAALPFLLEALAGDPQIAKIHNNLGSVYLKLQQLPAAEAAFRQATALNPNLAEPWKNLGQCQLKLGQPAEAAVSFEAALKRDPKDLSMLRLLSTAYEQARNFGRAEEVCRRALELVPDDPHLLNDLANVLWQQRRLAEAAELYDLATRIDVNHARIWSNYGAALHELKRLPEAETALKQALRLQPDYGGAHFNLANLYRDMLKHELALEHYRRAVELSPNVKDFRLNYVTLLNTMGDFAESAVQCRGLIDLDPDYAPAYYNLFTFNSSNVTEEEVAQLERLLQQPEINGVDKANAYFSLGKRCDQLKRYDEAVVHFQKANALTPRRYQFRYEDLQAQLECIRNVFSPEAAPWARLRGSESARPIFILGMPRSGSTLVEQILTSHRSIGGAGEFDGIRHLISNLLTLPFQRRNPALAGYPASVQDVTQSYLDEMADVYLSRMVDTAGEAERITDKMPNNAFQLGLIATLFPKATVIYTCREPRDIALSCYFQNFTTHHEFSYDMRNIGKFYREHALMMDYWRNVLPITIHDIVYEELVADQEAKSRWLIEDVCGLPWDENCLQFHRNDRAVLTASLWQVRQPIYRQSVQKWKNYASLLKPFEEELAVLEQRRSGSSV